MPQNIDISFFLLYVASHSFNNFSNSISVSAFSLASSSPLPSPLLSMVIMIIIIMRSEEEPSGDARDSLDILLDAVVVVVIADPQQSHPRLQQDEQFPAVQGLCAWHYSLLESVIFLNELLLLLHVLRLLLLLRRRLPPRALCAASGTTTATATATATHCDCHCSCKCNSDCCCYYCYCFSRVDGWQTARRTHGTPEFL